MKCIFCNKPLEKGQVIHDECNIKLKSIKNYLYRDYRLTVGMSTCGRSAGAQETYNILKDAGLKPEAVGCSGICYKEPIVTLRYNGKNYIYGDMDAENTLAFAEKLKEGKVFKKTLLGNSLDDIEFFKKQTRLLMSRCGFVSPESLKQYIATDGFSALQEAVKLKPKEVIEKIKDSGLKGRGGAGFPTGLKWQFLAENKNDEKYIVVNADEGDPGAFMNRTLMESDPFQLLEGFIIASFATKAKHGIIYTRAEYPLAVKTLQDCINTLKEHNLLGKSILGIKNFDFDIKIMKGAGAFVCGEETSLMKSIEGKRGHPTPRPPYPAQSGIFGKPTNINNVESYSHVPHIINLGEKYKKYGDKNNSGTKCICLTGKIKRSGVIEIPLSMPLKKIIFDIGGGVKNNKEFKAAQTGGPSGGCVTYKELGTPLDYDHIKKLGTIMGSGGLVVMDSDDCMVDVAEFFLTFTKDESCGKCTPCREGTHRMLELVDKITKGIAKESDLKKLEKLASVVQDTSLCGLGQSAPNPVLSTIKKFRSEYLAHINDKTCPAKKCLGLLHYYITDRCVGCGNCEKHCPVNAITGTLKKQFTIDQDKCIKCGHCYKACAFNAITRE